jgi:hypothetical protein
MTTGGGGIFSAEFLAGKVPGDWFQHRAVQEYMRDVLYPGAQLEVPIPGAPGPKGEPGRADIVYGNEIWEVKPVSDLGDRTGLSPGQRQLARYTRAMPGIAGTQETFDVPYGNGHLQVSSYGRPGMLYYEYKEGPPKPDPLPVPRRAPASEPESKPEPADNTVRNVVIGGAAVVGVAALVVFAPEALPVLAFAF